MSCNIQLIICDSTPTTGPISLHLPAIKQITLPDCQTINNHVDIYATSSRFIILFFDSNGTISNNEFRELRQKTNVSAICICVKSLTNFTYNGANVYPVAKQFLRYKLTSCVINCFNTIINELLLQNNRLLASSLETRICEIKHQLRSTDPTFDACHVLVVAMNASQDILLDFFESFIELCNNLCGDYDPVIYLLDNYFPSNDQPNVYGDDTLEIKCAFLKKISGMRLYLFGNEQENLHSLSESLYHSEIIDPSGRSYDEKYTCMEYQSITTHTTSTVLGYLQQRNDMNFKRLEQIQNDIELPAALDRVHATLLGRTISAMNELNQQARNSIEFSAGSQFTDQAQTGPTSNSDDEIENTIQCSTTHSTF